MNKILIVKGAKYAMLEVVGEAKRRILPSGQVNRFALCKCVCGKVKEIRLLHLVRLRTRSCGCIMKGFRGGVSSEPLYKKWKGMKDRCKPIHIDRHIYFDRGIKLCDEWENDYNAFKDWAIANGYDPVLAIDRKDNEKGYSPSNCRFVTDVENANNRRNTFFIIYKGESRPLALVIREKYKDDMLHYPAILRRIKRGWSHDKAIDTPIRKGNYTTIDIRN